MNSVLNLNAQRAQTVKAMALAGAMSVFLVGTGVSQDKRTLTIVGFETLQRNLMATGIAEGGVDLIAKFQEEFGVNVDFVLETSTSIKDALNRLGTLPASVASGD